MRKPNILLHNIVHLTDMFTFRCKLPDWENDTFSPFSEIHNQSIYQWIPVDKDGILDSCKIYTNNNETVENRLVKHYDKFGL